MTASTITPKKSGVNKRVAITAKVSAAMNKKMEAFKAEKDYDKSEIVNLALDEFFEGWEPAADDDLNPTPKKKTAKKK